ncbi:MAG: hypothetical protein JW904_02805 [Spirochaetales bacterium]|nr:hypothetical protein [Spirochaetales bacterium]
MKYFLFLLCIQALGCGCSFFSDTRDISLTIPEPDPTWQTAFPELYLQVTVYSDNNDKDLYTVDSGVTRISIPIRKSAFSFIIADWYKNNASIGLKPLGAVYGNTDGTGTDTLALSYCGGFVAERCLSCIKKGYDINGFNAHRLVSLLEERGTNPWSFDTAKIEQDIAGKTFNTFSLKQLETAEHKTVLEEGTWFFNSLYYQPIISNGIDEVSLGQLPFGFHVLFHQSTGKRIELMVDKYEVIALTPL